MHSTIQNYANLGVGDVQFEQCTFRAERAENDHIATSQDGRVIL